MCDCAAAHPHGLDGIVGILDRLAGVPLDLMREQELVDYVNAVVLHAERGHHLGRNSGRVGIGGLDGCHCCGGEGGGEGRGGEGGRVEGKGKGKLKTQKLARDISFSICFRTALNPYTTLDPDHLQHLDLAIGYVPLYKIIPHQMHRLGAQPGSFPAVRGVSQCAATGSTEERAWNVRGQDDIRQVFLAVDQDGRRLVWFTDWKRLPSAACLAFIGFFFG